MSAAPKFGRTVRAHVDQSLAQATEDLAIVSARIAEAKRIARLERDELRRRLAGVISDCETVRIWLEAGTPQ
jgi:siroheme synthase (precorrin-2 oxidase/ferrochelatase)